MRTIENISADAYQRHLIPLGDEFITVDFKFLSTVTIWQIYVTYKDKSINGVKLSVGCPHVLEQNWPFDFYIVDNSENGIDPYRLDDFSEGRCTFVVLDPDDVEEVRGYPVEL